MKFPGILSKDLTDERQFQEVVVQYLHYCLVRLQKELVDYEKKSEQVNVPAYELIVHVRDHNVMVHKQRHFMVDQELLLLGQLQSLMGGWKVNRGKQDREPEEPLRVARP
jgi:hypothetical protein